MMRQFIYILSITILTISIAVSAVAQSVETRTSISGIVLERGSNSRIPDVNVTNVRTNKTVRTNIYGVFFIEASIGDSLSFSKVGYGPVKTVLNTQEDILVDMQPGLEIETVVITRSTREAEMRNVLRDYGKKGVYNGGHNSFGTYIASPATALYNLFGKDPKNMKRFEQYMNKELEASKIDRVFNKQIVAELTSLEGDDLKAFMELYRPSLSSVEKWGQYDLMVYINNSFKSWNDNGRPRPERLPKLEIPPQEK